MTPVQSRDILDFWFGNEQDDAKVASLQDDLWWKKSESTDASIRRQFGAVVEQVGQGELDHWATDAEGLLALILLLDQWPRNIYRGQPQAFALDDRARFWCRRMLRDRLDQSLRPIQRLFAYLPLEHSENLQDQDQCVRLMQALADSVPGHQRETFDDFVDYAERHRAVIERFGRFPHRNTILGRPSTDEEVEFLKQPGSSF